MSHWAVWFVYALWLALFAGLALAILAVGYAGFRAREARREQALAPRDPGPDAADELARLNAALAAELVSAQASLERTRATLERGIKG